MDFTLVRENYDYTLSPVDSTDTSEIIEIKSQDSFSTKYICYVDNLRISVKIYSFPFVKNFIYFYLCDLDSYITDRYKVKVAFASDTLTIAGVEFKIKFSLLSQCSFIKNNKLISVIERKESSYHF